MMETVSNENVRLNRDRIRKNIKASLTNNELSNSSQGAKSLRKIKLQQNLKQQPNLSKKFEIFDDTSYLNHIFPCSSFETMFELLEKIG